MLQGKVLIAQGGGPTAVINQSVVGAVLEARKYPQVTKIYGALNGVSGILNEEFIDLTQETTYNLEQVANTPSSGLLSTRDKPDEAYCKEMFKIMQAHDIRYFFYIGGNDSSDTVRIVSEEAKRLGYDFRAVHIPKTIDNDLDGQRPHPWLWLCRKVRCPGLYGGKSGQPCPAGSIYRCSHGQTCRLP
jgi:6-phosphofructokinase